MMINKKRPLSWKDKPIPGVSIIKIVQLILAVLLIAVQQLLFFVPVRKNRIMLFAYKRKGLSCNPKYIALQLKEVYGDKAELIWLSMYPETCDEARLLGFKVIKYNSLQNIIMYLRTNVFITNDCFPVWAAHRNHVWINTWHGAMNYKHIGYEYAEPMNWAVWKLFLLKNRQADYFLSGSRFFAENTADSFQFEPDIFLSVGLPRNDILVNQTADKEELRRQILGEKINPGDHLVMYAPTFRMGERSSTHDFDVQTCLESLEKRFGGHWVMLFRNHAFIKDTSDNHQQFIDVSGYKDMQELLYISDVLISDYSSCMYDFILQNRPCFVYAPDMEQYRDHDRSFAYSPDKWPYAIATTNAQLQDNILNYDQANFENRVRQHFADTCSYDSGTACISIVRLVAEVCNL